MKYRFCNKTRRVCCLNIHNIEIGATIKNYKEMCNLLDEPVKTGCSKQAQMKNWERFFKFRKEGKTGFVIEEVYDTEIPKTIKNDAIYTKLIELILMNKLSLSDNFSIEATKNNLYEMLGLVNNNYTNPQKKSNTTKEFAKKHSKKTIGCSLPVLSYKKSEFYCNDFFTYTNNRLDKILDDALKSMEKRKLIHYNIKYKIVTVINEGATFISTEEASKEEIKNILETKLQVKEDYPEFNYITAYNYNKYVNILNKVFKKKYGWDSVYSVVHIIINEKYIRNNIPEVKAELEAECLKQKIELNMVAIDKFNEYFEKQYIRHQLKCFYEYRDKIIGNLKTNVHNLKDLQDLSELTDTEIADLMVECKNNDYNTYKKVLDGDYVKIQQELVGMFIKIEDDRVNEEVKTD